MVKLKGFSILPRKWKTQLLTARHEASGTGSMKFLMNGCLLLANEKLVRDLFTFVTKVVSLLYVQIHGKTLQSPGRAISVAISQLKAKIPNIEKCLDVVATLQVRKGTVHPTDSDLQGKTDGPSSDVMSVYVDETSSCADKTSGGEDSLLDHCGILTNFW